MYNFSMSFSNPWLLLLLIPAFGLTFFTYFRLSKKYRKTRNRIISMVLHCVVMVLCISVLAGINFSYDLPNASNEIMLVVDCSYSGEGVQEEKDAFVKSVTDKVGSSYRVGVVTFGFDQVYAVELTDDASDVYERYLDADRPDDSATDIAAALNYAKTLFDNPKTAKIVLVSDGLETDESALNVIKSITAEGIKVDTVYISADLDGNEVQIDGAELPDYNVAVGDSFNLTLSLTSSFAGDATVVLYDNGVESSSVPLQITAGGQTVVIPHSFSLPGFHELRFEVTAGGDTLNENNTFYTYKYLEVFDKILIIDGNHTEGETDRLESLFSESSYKVTVVAIDDETALPATLAELRAYDEVVLMNVANDDMPEGFIEILYSYVYEIGGGLFTVGGNRVDQYGEEVANAYNREDLAGTLFQDMLPVQAIDYTPPVAVVIIIDSSGSMTTQDAEIGKSAFELAKDGALACLNGLSERDYVGVMTLGTEAAIVSPILPVTQKYKIVEAIDALSEARDSTNYAPAIDYAGAALSAISGVERRHIVIVSDGYPTDSAEDYLYYTQNNYENSGITLSVIVVDVYNDNAHHESMETNMTVLAETGGGRFYDVTNMADVPRIMREELNVPEIKEVNYEEFVPVINSYTSVMNGITQEDMPALTGYYGTKAKDGATVVLKGDYVPIYAQWKYGAGTVASFMCDLNGVWSEELLSSTTGQRFLLNVVNALFPTNSIRVNEIDAVFTEDNYHNQVSIYTEMSEEQSIRMTITTQAADGVSDPVVQIIEPAATEDYSRMTFILTQPGIHNVLIEKLDAEGTMVAQYTTYRVLSYSEEYDWFADAAAGEELLAQVAQRGNGAVISDAWDVFDGIDRFSHRTYDPIIPFLIVALVLFLLDIAVRKFKFKWPHELLRERREKKSESNNRR